MPGCIVPVAALLAVEDQQPLVSAVLQGGGGGTLHWLMDVETNQGPKDPYYLMWVFRIMVVQETYTNTYWVSGDVTSGTTLGFEQGLPSANQALAQKDPGHWLAGLKVHGPAHVSRC